jgi:hypothetical protein
LPQRGKKCAQISEVKGIYKDVRQDIKPQFHSCQDNSTAITRKIFFRANHSGKKPQSAQEAAEKRERRRQKIRISSLGALCGLCGLNSYLFSRF